MKKTILTKSLYLSGLQCPKLLWAKVHDKKRFPEFDDSKLEEGENVGELARKNFDGVDLSSLDFNENLQRTSELIDSRKIIFEAGFLVDELYSRADVLIPNDNGSWDIVEVKSGTKVKDVNIDDLSFQKYVYEKAGLKINKCSLMHIDSTYIRGDELEISKLFIVEDMTDEVNDAIVGIDARIESMLNVLNLDEPDVKISENCSKPYECSLTQLCWSSVPSESVFDFSSIRKKKAFSLYDNGIKLMSEVPDDIKLNDKQKIQRDISKSNLLHIEKENISKFLDDLKYPLYYLDFETINPAIPKFVNSKPYQQIPFQYSLHIQRTAGGEVEHIEFLAEGRDDPRGEFLKSLQENLEESGDIIVYNQAFEKMILKQSTQVLTEYGSWHEKNILPRIKDLLDVFKKFWYYNPMQKGSCSIKAVLPVLSNLSYTELEIRKGDIASSEFSRVTYNDVDEEDRESVRKSLLEYCKLDTLAEVEIVSALRKLI